MTQTVPSPRLTLAPLLGLCARAGRGMPRWEAVTPEEVPEPQRTLLVHARDMTRTLEQFHRGTIVLRVLSSGRTGSEYWRESALQVEGSGRVVEFGAIQIFLDRFPEPWRSAVLDERRPLGGILNASGIPYSSAPSGYFRCVPDPFIRSALRLGDAWTGWLHGRQNTLSGGDGRPLAEIVEILPPA